MYFVITDSHLAVIVNLSSLLEFFISTAHISISVDQKDTLRFQLSSVDSGVSSQSSTRAAPASFLTAPIFSETPFVNCSPDTFFQVAYAMVYKLLVKG